MHVYMIIYVCIIYIVDCACTYIYRYIHTHTWGCSPFTSTPMKDRSSRSSQACSTSCEGGMRWRVRHVLRPATSCGQEPSGDSREEGATAPGSGHLQTYEWGIGNVVGIYWDIDLCIKYYIYIFILMNGILEAY